MAQSGPSKRLRRLRWMISALCAIVIAINFMDRSTIAIANVSIRQEFGLSATAMGGLISAWSFAYALSQIPAGFLVDRVGSRRLLGIALFVWSVAQAAGGFAVGFTQLLLTRAALGVSEAPAWPTSARVTGLWYRANERGLPTGVYTGASQLAPALAPPILTALMLAFGWRAMFVFAGVLGVIISIIWMWFYKDVEEADLSADDRSYTGAGEAQRTSSVTLRQWARLFKFRTVWGLILGSFGLAYLFWMYFGWLPAFLEMRYHVSIARTGILSALPFLGGIGGALCGGYFSDILVKRGCSLITSRKIPTIGGLVGMAVFTAGTALANNVPLALACVFLVVFCGMVCTAGLWSLVTVLTPPNYIASTASIPNCSAYIGATCSPIVTGYLVDVTGSFDAALFAGSAVGIVCAGFYLFMVRNPVLASDLETEDLLAILPGRQQLE
jgi:sugar phosphate permease